MQSANGAILDSLRRLVRSLRSSALTAEKNLGISVAQLFALKVLAREGRLSVNELAELTLTHQSTISVLVDKLTDKGLCLKSVSAEDRRKAVIEVTKRGLAVAKKSALAPQEKLVNALERMTAADRLQLSHLLGKWITLAQLDDEPPTLFFEAEPTKQTKR